MTGAFSSSQASTMAWSSSMLLTLKAPRAYLPLRALANNSLVCVRGMGLAYGPDDRASLAGARHRRKRKVSGEFRRRQLIQQQRTQRTRRLGHLPAQQPVDPFDLPGQTARNGRQELICL